MYDFNKQQDVIIIIVIIVIIIISEWIQNVNVNWIKYLYLSISSPAKWT